MIARLFFVVLAISACAIPSRAQTVSDPNWVITPVLPNNSFSQPTSMAFIGANDFLVLEKGTGLVRRVTDGVLNPTFSLNLAVANDSERGLLGIAVHPNFGQTALPNNDSIYLYYSRSSTGSDGGAWQENRVSRFTWNGATLGNESVVAVLGSSTGQGGQSIGPNHNGGPIAFGPDGKLYGIVGDLNRSRAEQNNTASASATSFVGGVYRLNDDGTIPADNPFITNSNPDLQRWYAYGIRNSFGIAFDPANGNLWDTENGPESYDEVNLVSPGFNSGWTKIMGPDSRDPQGLGDLVNLAPGGVSTYADPKFSWLSTVAPTAIHFLQGSALGPAYDNKVLVGDNNTGSLYMFTLNAARDGFDLSGGVADLVADSTAERNSVTIGTGFGALTDLVRARDGSLYGVSLSNGTIYHITSTIVPGDFDGDHDVDGADFVAWQTHYPTTAGATLAQGDSDGDGDVDGADFAVWQSHFGSPGDGSTPVPEPTGAGLMLATAIGLLAPRRKTGVGREGCDS